MSAFITTVIGTGKDKTIKLNDNTKEILKKEHSKNFYGFQKFRQFV